MITLGAEVGCGLVINDALVTGDRDAAGTVGHWPLPGDGPECRRGHRGCASTLLTTGGLAARCSEAVGTPLTFDDCVRLAGDGDPAVRVVFETSAYHLGQLCARIADLIAPRRLLLSGDGIAFAMITEDVVRRGFADQRDRTDPEELIMERLDADDWARGAAVVAIRHHLLGGLEPRNQPIR